MCVPKDRPLSRFGSVGVESGAGVLKAGLRPQQTGAKTQQQLLCSGSGFRLRSAEKRPLSHVRRPGHHILRYLSSLTGRQKALAATTSVFRCFSLQCDRENRHLMMSGMGGNDLLSGTPCERRKVHFPGNVVLWLMAIQVRFQTCTGCASCARTLKCARDSQMRESLCVAVEKP